MCSGHAVARMQKETIHTVETINHANAPYIAQRVVDDTIAERERVRQAADSTHLNLITQNSNATTLKVDPATANLIRLERERARVQIETAQQLAAIEVGKAKEIDINRLAGYRIELSHDLEFLLRRKLMTHQEVLAIKANVQTLLQERDEIEQMKVSEPTKNRMLVEQDKVIEAFQRDLSEQILRLRAKTGDGQNPTAIDAAPDSPSGSG